MNIFLSLLRKDFRATAPWLAASAASWLPMLALPAVGWSPDHLSFFYICFLTLGGAVGFLAVSKIIHQDPLADAIGFLAVRPISRTRLLAAKIAFVFAGLVLPGAVIRFTAFALVSVSPSQPDLAGLFAQQLILGSALVAAVLPPALWTSALPRMIIVTVATYAAFVVLYAAYLQVTKISPRSMEDGPSLSILRVVLAQAVFVGAALIAAWLLARSRRPVITGCVFFVILGCGFAALRNWTPPNRELAEISLPPSARILMKQSPSLQTELRDDQVLETLLMSYELQGIPRGRLLLPIGVTTIFRGAAGEKTFQRKINWSDFGSSSRDNGIAIKEWLGIPLGRFDFKSPGSLQLAQEPQSDQPFAGIAMDTVHGEVEFLVLQPTIIATLPARVGAETTFAQSRIRLMRISSSSQAIETRIVIQSLVSPFRSVTELPRWFSKYWIVAKNTEDPAKSFCSSPGGFSSTGAGPISIKDFDTDIVPREEGRQIPRDWVQQSVIQIVSTAVVGRVVLPFTTPPKSSAP